MRTTTDECTLMPPIARSANVRFCRIVRYPGEVRQVEIPPDVAGMAIRHG